MTIFKPMTRLSLPMFVHTSPGVRFHPPREYSDSNLMARQLTKQSNEVFKKRPTVKHLVWD